MSRQRKRSAGSKVALEAASDPSNATSLTTAALLLAAAGVAPLGLRAALLWEGGGMPGSADLRGLISDAAAASVVALAAGALARWSRLGALAALGAWVLLCYGNHEHVRANGANMALLYAGYLADPTFLQGSALALSQPVLLAAVLGATLGLAWLAVRPSVRAKLAPLAGAAAAGGLLLALWNPTPAALGWRQASFFWQNARWLVRPADRPSALPDSASGFLADLDGKARVPLGRDGTNVILLVLEGVSGAFLEPVAEANQRQSAWTLPELSRIAREHMVFTNFIAQQRQTNRGEYALLCGDSARLVSAEPKMSELAVGGRSRCLPAALAEAGYATAYLQAAPLAFMMKDRFMPRIGFERSYGDTYFSQAYSRNKWGVDDRSFLQQSLKLVDEMRAGERPWFLTLLSVGTHHPVNVPAEFPGMPDRENQRAFRYLDAAVGEFVSELDERGVLDDTLVLITSDESQGLVHGLSDIERLLSQSWGFLIALLPGGAPQRVDVPQMQLDVALSTLDYLGLGERAGSFQGRSIFRDYAKPRSVAFGNTYMKLVGGVNDRGMLVICGEDLGNCLRGSTREQHLFASDRDPLATAGRADAGFLAGLVAESLRLPPGASAEAAEGREFVLAESPVFAVRDDVNDLQWVFGGQYLTLPAGSRVEVDLEIVVGGESGRVVVQHALKAGDTNFFARRVPSMQPGDRLHFRYTWSTTERVDKLENYLVVTREAGASLRLELPRASMRIVPAPGPIVTPLLVLQHDVELADAS